MAQAVDSLTKTGGTPLRSNVVTIATNSGLCHNPIVSGSNRNFQAQSFIANLNYISDDEQHPNTLHISVSSFELFVLLLLLLSIIGFYVFKLLLVGNLFYKATYMHFVKKIL